MKKIFLFSLSLWLVFSCASSSQKTEKDTEIPGWVNDPYTVCQQSEEFCTVGEGPGVRSAEAQARKSMAQIFETKVESETLTETTAFQEESQGVIEGASSLHTETQIREVTDEVLNGVTILKRYIGAKSVYALASLNRPKAADYLRTKMKTLDDELGALYRQQLRGYAKKMMELFLAREQLNLRYQLLQGTKYPPRVSFKDIDSQIQGWRQQKTKVFLDWTGDEAVKSLVTKALVDHFYLVTAEKDDTKYQVKGSLQQTKEHFNVEGFEKYRFNFKLTATNSQGQKQGAMKLSFAQTGRDISQILPVALEKINEHLQNKLYELNIR